MPEFLRLSLPFDALQILLQSMPEKDPPNEVLSPSEALGRVLAEDVQAPHSLPEFPRSTVDGYAVRARYTFGASEALPSYLNLTGEVPMGDSPTFELMPGTCASIHTGGMIPRGADAVVMLEHTQTIIKNNIDPIVNTEIEILRPVAEGENVLLVGEDVVKDQIVMAAGKRIRPAEIGGCMALGINKLRVAINPKIGIISSGDEVIPAWQRPHPGQVRDVNSYSLASLVGEAGGEAVLYGIVPDNLEKMKKAAARAKSECNAVIITAGSSASARDMTAEAIASLGDPGILIHGVNVRPGKPTILAVCDGKAIIGLPGNPVSALVIAGLFVVPVIDKLSGLKFVHPRQSVKGKLKVNVVSQSGREDWVAVKIHPSHLPLSQKEGGDCLVEPVFGKSNLIFSLVVADGLICIPSEMTGLSAGETVEVMLM